MTIDLHSGTPFWCQIPGPRAAASPLDKHLTCDVAIIGSGITGALLAWTLAREGRSVVVIDHRGLAEGSTLASTALLQYDLDVPLHQLAPKIGWEKAARAFQIGVEAIDLLEDIGRQVGSRVDRLPSIYFVRDESKLRELEAELTARRRAGLCVRWLDEAALRERYGLNAVAAILSDVGGQANPNDLTHALLIQAVELGRAQLFDRTRVTKVEADDAGVLLHTEHGNTVRAPYVVHATGYEAVHYLPPELVRLVSTYAIVSQPLAEPRPVDKRFLMWEYADPYLYARWVGDRLLVGGEDVPFKDESLRDALIDRQAAVLVKKFTQLMPDTPIEPALAWTGTFGTTEDGLGYIGPPPGRPRELFALGFGGNGITFSTLASVMIADYLAGRPNPDAHVFSFERKLAPSP